MQGKRLADLDIKVLEALIAGSVAEVRRRGHEEQYYREHIQVAAPYCSIAAGIPLMFLAGRWVGGWWEDHFAVKAALGVWLAYALIDTSVALAAGMTSSVVVPDETLRVLGRRAP